MNVVIDSPLLPKLDGKAGRSNKSWGSHQSTANPSPLLSPPPLRARPNRHLKVVIGQISMAGIHEVQHSVAGGHQ